MPRLARSDSTLPADPMAGRWPMPRLRRMAWLGVFAALLLAAGPAWAQLMVHPTRLVLGPGERAGQLEIINGGSEPASYSISLVNRRMGEHGEFSAIDTPLPGEQFADDMLRYSPRRVTLAPGASQVIRIMARRPAALEPGEYRSHLLFSRLPDPETTRSKAAGDSGDDEGIGIALTALVGISIPVIVREGDTSAEVGLADMTVSAPPGSAPVLSLAMLRTGNQSVYGDLVATFAPDGGTAVEIGRAAGVAVYTPNDVRRVRLVLTPPTGVALADGTLTVQYRERTEQGGAVLAESSLALP